MRFNFQHTPRDGAMRLERPQSAQTHSCAARLGLLLHGPYHWPWIAQLAKWRVQPLQPNVVDLHGNRLIRHISHDYKHLILFRGQRSRDIRFWLTFCFALNNTYGITNCDTQGRIYRETLNNLLVLCETVLVELVMKRCNCCGTHVQPSLPAVTREKNKHLPFTTALFPVSRRKGCQEYTCCIWTFQWQNSIWSLFEADFAWTRSKWPPSEA